MGFPFGTDLLGEEGESGTTVWETVLATHGEYLPVNQCLQDDAKSENEAVIVALKKFHNKRLLFLQNFQQLFQNAPELMNLTISNVKKKCITRM